MRALELAGSMLVAQYQEQNALHMKGQLRKLQAEKKPVPEVLQLLPLDQMARDGDARRRLYGAMLTMIPSANDEPSGPSVA